MSSYSYLSQLSILLVDVILPVLAPLVILVVIILYRSDNFPPAALFLRLRRSDSDQQQPPGGEKKPAAQKVIRCSRCYRKCLYCELNDEDDVEEMESFVRNMLKMRHHSA
ncbi:hypothetical protein QBC46DRAFT_340494 [Diplogelasinospora grovesii]|uniref:Uncharacterized protein n=1 Tax=Diplogelasinospora grovesii TaxID=303347 RepID=A0AAN6N9D1_9PEZI|nr:hypothetical protein QBC46DRAFT_340494 [Diplogelasinospora grovesii]